MTAPVAGSYVAATRRQVAGVIDGASPENRKVRPAGPARRGREQAVQLFRHGLFPQLVAKPVVAVMREVRPGGLFAPQILDHPVEIAREAIVPDSSACVGLANDPG